LPGQWKKYVSVKGKYIKKEWEFGDSGIYIFLQKKKKSISTFNHPYTIHSCNSFKSQAKVWAIQLIAHCCTYCRWDLKRASQKSIMLLFLCSAVI
jgi:hypothetical protein